MAEKILIVDDDLDSLKLIGLMLQRHGYEVVAASAGNQAIMKAQSELPDLIILDVMMPDMNGYEVCRRLKMDSSTEDIPIIMFTAKTLIDDKVAGFEAGADDYLTKPTHPQELASRVKAILQRRANKGNRNTARRGTTIGVVGAKGGIGTTTIALNLAATLREFNMNPIVADFRLGMGSLGLALGMGRSTGMANLLKRPALEINSSIIEQEIVVHPSGLRALLSSSRAKEGLINIPTDTALAIVREMRMIGKPSVFDLGCGYTPLLSRLQSEMDTLVMVVDPAGVTLAMAREMLQEIGRTDRERVYLVVVNRVQVSQQPPWHEVEHILGQDIRAIISPAPDLAFQAMEAATPLVYYQPNAVVSSQLIKMGEEIKARIEKS
ncbi:MAG: hypothetical protein CUN55_12285 [Phototrophicales bacterium]|nr:MAG: hypothetical protein CUN55_12285 [Phototrophicales bacterium]RMG71975.1 MAG: response regulator [Chloroflexota bacterium]